MRNLISKSVLAVLIYVSWPICPGAYVYTGTPSLGVNVNFFTKPPPILKTDVIVYNTKLAKLNLIMLNDNLTTAVGDEIFSVVVVPFKDHRSLTLNLNTLTTTS